MFDNSDAFIAIPGSYGTLDEILSAVNWRCYGAGKPIGLLNIRHFFDKLLEQFDTMVEEVNCHSLQIQKKTKLMCV